MVDIKQLILDGTKYESGYTNDEDKYVLSASMVANDPLQNYLSIIHGKGVDSDIGDNTLGSVFHLGMQMIMDRQLDTDMMMLTHTNGQVLGVESSMHTELPNGWIVSGTADLITEEEPNVFAIHDYKLSKSYAKKMMKKELYTHNYTIQLQVLDFLFRQDENRPTVINDNIKLYCEFFVKDAKAMAQEPTYERIVCPNTSGTEDMNAVTVMQEKLVAITDSLQAYIEAGEIPMICADRWPRNVKGKVISTRCALYCDHGKAGRCPHYNPSTMQAMDRLVNW